MKPRHHLALAAAALSGTAPETPLGAGAPVSDDVAAALFVQRVTGFETAIAMVGESECTLLVKLAAGKILRFSAVTWAGAANAALAGCKRYRPVQRNVPLPANPNRKMRRMQEAQQRRAK